MKVLPLFYDHSSQKSILTWWDAKDVKPNGPQSILPLCLENNIKSPVFISRDFSTFLEAWKACKSAKLKLIFGIEIIICDDALVRTPESRHNEHKIIVFAKNGQGYSDLLKVFSTYQCNIDFKYYVQRFDLKRLSELWTPNLYLAIPFFDGFISKNLLGFNTSIMPDLSFCGQDKIIFREMLTHHHHEALISNAIDKYVQSNPLAIQDTKTIYYKNRKDFLTYSVYRAIQNGQNLGKPELEEFCSDQFCFESWKEINDTNRTFKI